MKEAQHSSNGANGILGTSALLYRQIRQPNIKIVDSHGVWLFTEDGRRILDASSGAAVSCIGHNCKEIHRAIVDQLEKVEYAYSYYFTTPAAEELAHMMSESTDGEMSRVYIVGSGTEAVEAALKMARQYFTELPTPEGTRTHFIARKQSYHGNTLGSLSVSGHPPRRSLYEDMLFKNVSHISSCYPFRGKTTGETDDSYVARLAKELDDEIVRLGPKKVCAFIAETVCGSTLGAAAPVSGYFKAMRDVCDRHGVLLILDEVLSGMGRTGTMHAWEQEGIIPDLQTVAKGLGAGYASIGALLVNKKVVGVLESGTGAFSHSQTYQAHPLACAAALAVQKKMRAENLLENVRTQGKLLEKLLRDRLSDHPHVGDIRGRGLLWGLELVKDKTTMENFSASEKVSGKLHSMGLTPEYSICYLAANGTMDGKGDYIALAPPFNVSADEIRLMVDRTEKLLRDYFQGSQKVIQSTKVDE